MRVLLAGSGLLGLSLMNALLDSRHEVVGLVQNGRLRKTEQQRRTTLFVYRLLGRRCTVAGKALARGLPVLWLDRHTEEELAPLRALEPDVILVGAFGVILKPSILGLPRVGCINTHASLLPRHRGPNPYTAVIRAGELETGVTFHAVNEGIDTGRILAQYRIPVAPDGTALDIYRETAAIAGDHVVEVLDSIEAHGLAGKPQDEDVAFYDGKMEEEDYRIDWSDPAVEIDRLVRACLPDKRAWFMHRGRRVFVARVQVGGDTGLAPGTVIRGGWSPEVATGARTVTLTAAYVASPVPWNWPPFWGRVRSGDRLA